MCKCHELHLKAKWRRGNLHNRMNREHRVYVLKVKWAGNRQPAATLSPPMGYHSDTADRLLHRDRAVQSIQQETTQPPRLVVRGLDPNPPWKNVHVLSVQPQDTHYFRWEFRFLNAMRTWCSLASIFKHQLSKAKKYQNLNFSYYQSHVYRELVSHRCAHLLFVHSENEKNASKAFNF